MSRERVTRIEHDQLNIAPILDNYKFEVVD